MRKLRTGIIDIGSNTIRLVLYKYNQDEGLREFGNIKTVARLRKYIQPNGDMSEEGIKLLEDTLKSFKRILNDFDVTDVKATATAAIRQAKNNQDIIMRMEKETGITIDLLSGEEEAYFGYLAIVYSMDTPSAVSVDIGGGSTEVSLFINKELKHSFSFPFGTVSLKQKFVSGEIINEIEKNQLRAYIKNQFEQHEWIKNAGYPIIAIGGSARNVAQIHQQLINYPISGVHQYEMSRLNLSEIGQYLSKLTFEQLKQLDGLSSDRADIIGIALEVFRELMEVVDSKKFQVSKKGLREGLMISRVLDGNHITNNKHNVFEENARRITLQYGRTEEEVNTLCSLAEQLYKECVKLNLLHFQKEHYELLLKATKVFAIGEYIELDSSNQHTFYLLANQSIAGLSHINRIKLALLASYKNRDYFRRFSEPFAAWMSREELKVLRDYGALLKFVYAFNVSKRNIVKTIKLEKSADIILIKVITQKNAMAEQYQVERQKKHFERVIKKQVQIQFISEDGRLK